LSGKVSRVSLARMKKKIGVPFLLLVAAVAVAIPTLAFAGKTAVKKVSMSTTVHAVLNSDGTPSGVFEGKVTSGYAGCVKGATVILTAPPAPGDESGLTEYSANHTVKPNGTWELVLGKAGSPLIVEVVPVSVFLKVSKHKTIQCKHYKKSMPSPTS
jgi:hypothetical protein